MPVEKSVRKFMHTRGLTNSYRLGMILHEPKTLGYRSTVGRLTLDQLIGVRIPVPQPLTRLEKVICASHILYI